MKRALLLCLALLLSACGGESDDAVVSADSGNLILDSTHDDGAAWGLPDCSACHVTEVIHGEVPRIQSMVVQKGYNTCTGCHGRNGTQESEPRRCGVCHNDLDLPDAPQLEGAHGHGFVSGSSAALTDDQCLACHVASDMDGSFEVNRDLTRFPDQHQNYSAYQNISEFCLRCHNRDHQQTRYEIVGENYDDPLVAVEDAYHFVDQHGEVDGTGTRTYAGLRSGYEYQSVVVCTDCHAMHGTDNDKLIIDHSSKGVSKLDISLRQPGHSIVSQNGDYAQLCVMCHEMAVVLDSGDVDTGNGLAGVHEVGGDCRLCHTHGEAVQAGL